MPGPAFKSPRYIALEGPIRVGKSTLAKVLAEAITQTSSTDGPKVRDALAKADVAGVTGRLKMNAKRNVDKPAVIQEVTYANGDVKFVYKTTISPD